MAKEKQSKKPDPFKSAKDLIDKFGEHVIKTGTEHITRPFRLIPISPAIDIQIGGGIPEGSCVLLAGPPKCGKTVTALTICRNAQKQGRNIYYLNIEGRLKKRDLEGIKGLDLDKIFVIGSFREEDDDGKTHGKILTGEEWMSIAEHYIHSDPGCVVVLDSVSQLATETEFLAQIGDRTGDGGYRLMAQFTKRVGTVLPINRCTLIGIQHVIMNTRAKPGQKTRMRTGGTKVGYAVDVDLECYMVEAWKIGANTDSESESDDDDKEQIGQKVYWRTGSTAITPPGRKIVSWLRYGRGLDDLTELIEIGKQTGFIQRAGAWYTLGFMQDHLDAFPKELEWKTDKEGKVTGKITEFVRAQGAENLYELFTTNSSFIDILRKDIYTMLGYEYEQ